MSDLSQEELARTIAILESLVENRIQLASIPQEQRVALLTAAGRLSRPHRHETVKLSKAFRRIQRKANRAADRDARDATEIRAARRADVFSAPPRLPPGASSTPPRELNTPRNCYVCKAEFTRLHFFYDSMCEACAELNYEKRHQTAVLDGRVALITGARVKIGYQAALKMLRAGARVIVTTRFPHDAAKRYASEPDYAKFADRLQIHGLDLRHCPSVELFARYLEQTCPRLDFLVNNAAQTVRRPANYYAHLLEHEIRAHHDLAPEMRKLLRGHEACKSAMSVSVSNVARSESRSSGPGVLTMLGQQGTVSGGLAIWNDGAPGVGIRSSALLSQMPCTYEDGITSTELFPTGAMDADLQQVDLRATNSWRATLAEVLTAELLEVNLINAVAPFILCSKLKPLMMREPTGDRHIVNVTAMEGIFSRHTKTDKHPHTNMAKAALNMMTLTSAPDYAKGGIFMNAVDTGWVTDEDPAHISQRKQEMHDFQPPLDIVDGAARICDPFFSDLNTGVRVYGKFLKDYRPAPW
ncbi:SDR family oxidoreductase [Pendulispora brunnea]|uniref:SDR family oxidoreductase n=1 Tax=Pendulispora brunnea TaxID=2905690 RepID=A0ABZ2K6C4_9BACT